MVFRDDGKSGRYIFNQQVFKVVGGADQFDVVAVIEIDVAVSFRQARIRCCRTWRNSRVHHNFASSVFWGTGQGRLPLRSQKTH